ncbi:MAG: chromosome segregation protein SMC [Eubacteriales bacterium]|nr:chromosome segregation protein SMC [Eubacteriales bacterium]
MKFKSITLQGFKSFPERTTISFHDGITAVVGPNGSGKSNITDAIRWVLGEQSAKALRGARMEDVIFNGTQSRRPLSFCEVLLSLDNTDGQLNSPYQELEIRRRLYRSGESEYAINRQRCRLKDISELFLDSGIGRDGYSLVGQGRIDEILSPRGEDRRLVFDDAAGIAKFRLRRREAEQKLERTEQNLQRVQDIQREIETHIKPLEKQAQKALEARALNSEYSDLDQARLFNELCDLSTEIEKRSADFAAAQAELKEQSAKREAFIADNSRSLEAMQTLREEIKALQLTIESQKRELDQLDHEMRFTENNRDHAKQRAEELAADLERESLQLDRLATELETAKSNQNSESELELKRRNYETLELERKTLECEHRELREALELELANERGLQTQKYEISGRIQSYELEIRELQSREAREQSDAQRYQAQATELRQAREAKAAELDALSNQLEIKQQSLSEARDQLASEADLLKQIDAQRAKRMAESRELEYRLRALSNTIENNEGYYASVRALMDSLKNGELKKYRESVPGPLADLMVVEAKYEKAIEVAIGGNLQNIVVNTEHLARELIAHLRRHRLGRVTFLPFDGLSLRRIDSDQLTRLSRIDGYLGRAEDHVEIDSSYRIALEYRLGRILIARDLEAGQAISKASDRRYLVVTLDGDSIAAGGAITGGEQRQQRPGLGLIERRREYQDLQNKYAQLELSLAEDSKSYELAESRYLNSVKKVNELDGELENMARELRGEEAQQEFVRGEEERIKARLASYSDLNFAEDRKRIEAALVSERELLRKHDEVLLQSSESQKQISFRISGVTEKLESVQSAFESASLSFQLERREQERKLELITRLESELDTLRERQRFHQAEAHAMELKIQEADKRLGELAAKRPQTEEMIGSKLNTLSDLDLRYQQAETENSKFIEKLETLNELENRLSREEIRLEQGLENSKRRRDQALNELWENYQLTWKDREHRDLSHYDPAKTRKRLKQIRDQLREIGPVNENAPEAFEELKERYAFINKQYEDILAARVDLDQVLASISKEMRVQFESSFEFIQREFNSVFCELFGGGYAELVLEGDDALEANIQIRVSPPGKRMQNMLLLSGGERCLAAIALLFAIQRLKPSAFCVLDEVEAALDDANIFRFSDYLNRYAEDTQYIIVTHRKGTMEAADRIYGVSMPEKGISKILSIRLDGHDDAPEIAALTKSLN